MHLSHGTSAGQLNPSSLFDRVAISRPEGPDDVFAGCFPEWVRMEPIFAKGALVDVFMFGGGPDEKVAKVPSVVDGA